MVRKGDAAAVPDTGLSELPVGAPMVVIVRLPATGLVPVTVVEKACPTGATKVPTLLVVEPTTQVGDGRLEISTITSSGDALTTPARVDSRMSGRTKRCPLEARVRSQVRRQPPVAARTVGCAPPEGTEGMGGVKFVSACVAKRQDTGSKSGSNTGKR